MAKRKKKPKFPRPTGARRFNKEVESDLSLNSNLPVRNGYFKSFDGTRIFYSVEGEGKPLVFCYGLVCSSLHWTYQIEHFKRTHQVIWFDYRGHQNSDSPKDLDSLTLESMARDTELLLDELEIDKAVLLGHSMGVNVVLETYRRAKDRFQAMVLANGTPKRPLETLFSSNTFHELFKVLEYAYQKSPKLFDRIWKLQKGNPFSRAFISFGGFNPHLTPQEDISLYVDQVAQMDPAIFIHMLSNYSSIDATRWLHTIDAPTLILSGEQDRITPLREQELMHQLIRGSEHFTVRHGSHCPQMDLPQLVNLEIEKFLKSDDVLWHPAVRSESPNLAKESANPPNS